MRSKVQSKTSKGFIPSNTKSYRFNLYGFYSGRSFRQAIDNFISKQFLSLFVNFYPLVKH